MSNSGRAPRFVKNPSGYHSHGATHQEKVYNLGVYIKQFGWTGGWDYDEDAAILKATMNRGEGEKIEIEWPDVQWWPDVFYTYAGATQKCRNISEAAKIAASKPDPSTARRAARKRSARVTLAGALKGRETGAGAVGTEPLGETPEALIAAMSTTLPFDRESTPDEIKAVIKQHRNPVLIWVNRLSGAIEQDYIKTWSRHLKVTVTKEGKTIIHFVGEHQFHAVYVDSVIGVS